MANSPQTSLRELEQISLKLEDDTNSEDPEYLKWLNMLIAPGASLVEQDLKQIVSIIMVGCG